MNYSRNCFFFSYRAWFFIRWKSWIELFIYPCLGLEGHKATITPICGAAWAVPAARDFSTTSWNNKQVAHPRPKMRQWHFQWQQWQLFRNLSSPIVLFFWANCFVNKDIIEDCIWLGSVPGSTTIKILRSRWKGLTLVHYLWQAEAPKKVLGSTFCS